DQSTSLIFSKLPLELREMIYTHVFGGSAYHMSSNSTLGRINAFKCKYPDPQSDLKIHKHGICHAHDNRRNPDLVPILLACRRIYSEAVPLLYSTATFNFTQEFCLARWARMMLPQQRLRDVKRLVFYCHVENHRGKHPDAVRDWKMLWGFLGRDLGLRWLCVDFAVDNNLANEIKGEKEEDAGWLEPMMKVVKEMSEERKVKIEILIRSIDVDLGEIWEDTDGADTGETKAEKEAERIRRACRRAHERIRDCLVRND
ncbi:hypothetical protein K402DRAFT_334190, partial [Aulographum hederae CBS 113979]